MDDAYVPDFTDRLDDIDKSLKTIASALYLQDLKERELKFQKLLDEEDDPDEKKIHLDCFLELSRKISVLRRDLDTDLAIDKIE